MALTTQDVTKADAIRTQYAADLERARAAQLNADALRQRVAALYVKAKTSLAALSSSSEADIAAQRRALMQVAFGLGHLTSSAATQADLATNYRDAQSRAADLTTEQDASAALERALDSNDELMARAICWQAWTTWPRWYSVINAYVDTRPGVEKALQGLQDLESSKLSAMDDAWQTAGALYLPTPTELGGLSDYQISALANA